MIFLWVIIFTVLHMACFWVFYRLLKNPSVVDVGWASVLTCSGWIYWLHGNLSWVSFVFALLLLVWGLRLGGYLWLSRVSQGHQDKRYTQLSDNWKIARSLGFFINFQLQGLMAFFIAISFYFISYRTGFTWLDGLAVLMIVIGLIGESIADYQLQWYKKHGTSPVCQTGLWRYSRHPNYFFDWLTWVGFAMVATATPWGWLAWISPLTLYTIMVHITGPMTESGSVSSRGNAYIAYQKQTNMFFPCTQKRH